MLVVREVAYVLTSSLLGRFLSQFGYVLTQTFRVVTIFCKCALILQVVSFLQGLLSKTYVYLLHLLCFATFPGILIIVGYPTRYEGDVTDIRLHSSSFFKP
jgi:hypothetical protein